MKVNQKIRREFTKLKKSPSVTSARTSETFSTRAEFKASKNSFPNFVTRLANRCELEDTKGIRKMAGDLSLLILASYNRVGDFPMYL